MLGEHAYVSSADAASLTELVRRDSVRALMHRHALALALLALFTLPACSAGPEKTATPPDPAATAAEPAATSAAAPATAASPHCLGDDEQGCTAKCDAGDLESCSRLASIYHFGNANAREDLSKSKALYEKACSGDLGKACYFLAGFFELGRGAAKDPGKAKALVDKAAPRVTAACDAGDGESCSILADMYMIGKGVSKSEAKENELRAKATEKYGKACAADDPSACFMYGGDLVSAHRMGDAAKALKRGCDAGDAASCSLLGGMYDEGAGVPQDAARAKEVWLKACKGGIEAACSRLSPR